MARRREATGQVEAWRQDFPGEEGIGVRHPSLVERPTGLRRLRVTYEVDGEVIVVVERDVTEKYVWFLRGNSSWREF